MTTSKAMETYIAQVLSYAHELQKISDINVHHIQSSRNFADLFTKSLSTAIFRKVVTPNWNAASQRSLA